MSIQSRFNDYYDWLFYSYRDPNFYWKRETTRELINKKIENDLWANRTTDNDYLVMRSFNTHGSGCLTTDVEILRTVLLIGNKIDILYYVLPYQSRSGLTEFECPDKDDIKFFRKRSNLVKYLESKSLTVRDNEIFNDYSPDFLEYVRKLFREYHKEPIVTVINFSDFMDALMPEIKDLPNEEPARDKRYGREFPGHILKVINNPNLSALRLDENPLEQDIYTEINLYINQLNGVETDVIRDDVIKRNAHGFDQQSFKTRKK